LTTAHLEAPIFGAAGSTPSPSVEEEVPSKPASGMDRTASTFFRLNRDGLVVCHADSTVRKLTKVR
jgi:hypothetical protein